MKVRRMVLADLSAGVKGILTEYEKQLKTYALTGYLLGNEVFGLGFERVDLPIAEQNFEIAKQKLMRKLYRMENGTNLTDVERLKRDMRRLAKAYVDMVTDNRQDHSAWVLALSITEGKRRL